MAQDVSCIVPVNNGERYLGETIASILAQTYEPLELIVVDNGSTDDSAEIARSFGDRVRLFQQVDLGPPGGRNRGIRESTSDFIAFCDADDLFLPEKIERQMAPLAARPEIDISLCTAECFWEEGLEDEEARYIELGRTQATHIFGTMLARRDVFDRVGFLDEDQFQSDGVDWFARAGDAALVVDVLPDVLVRRRMHRESITHRRPDMDAFIELVHRRIRAHADS
jgi:glycosyltransferase involved in cell wall biosynthesis